MKRLSWKSRGAGKKAFPRNLIDIMAHRPDLVIILDPRVRGERAPFLVNQLAFYSHHIADPIGRSGGLWLLWDAGICKIEVLDSSSQVIHALVSQGSSPDWLLSAVYASPSQ